MEGWHIALLVAVIIIIAVAVWRMKKAEGCCGEKFLPITGDNWLARGIPETMYIPIRGDNWLAR